MARSAVDATRFTSTTPHVSAKPSALSNPGSLTQRAGPPGETPQEKVKRLREAAARVRDAKISTFDKAIIVGRVWADRVHRFTALSLIGLTGIAGAVTVYALGDMIVYNRRKRAEYYAQQRVVSNKEMQDAQKAVGLGATPEEQRSFIIENEQTGDTKSAKTPGIFARSKEWLFSGFKKEESADLGTQKRILAYEGTPGHDTVSGKRDSILGAVEKNAAAKSNAETLGKGREPELKGELLDQLDTGAKSSPASPPKETPKSGSLFAFLSRR